MGVPRNPQSGFDAPVPGRGAEDAAMSYAGQGGHPASAAEAAIARHESRLMSINGVQGVSLGEGGPGGAVIVVYVRDHSVAQRLPAALEGYRVEAQVVGVIDAY